MFYRTKKQKIRKMKNVKARESLEIFNISGYPVYDIGQKSNSRKRKKNQSRIEQKNWNDKNAKEYFYRKAMCNFDTTDYIWHVTFDDDNRPKDKEEADKIFGALMKKVNRIRRSKKYKLERARYMGVVEHGESGQIHWHILIDGDLHRDILEEVWTKGSSNIDRLQFNDEGIKNLCRYILKDTKGKKRWKPSRGNLIEPPTPTINDNEFSKREMIKMATNQPSREEVEKMYPGYTLTDIKFTVDDIYGGIYMKIEMRRYIKNDIKDKGGPKERKQSKKRE